MLRIILFAILTIFAGQNWAAKIYKWVDENGQIHYSSKKPVNQEVETVKVRKGPKVEAKSTADSNEAEQSAATDDSDVDTEAQATARNQLATADIANREKECDLARKNHTALNATVRVVRTNENGETVRMTDSERVSALANAEKGIDEYCN